MGQTVLVVDDDLKIINLLRLYLEREGYGVLTASDGRGALEAAARTRPSLIILDLMLPHTDGWEVCRQLRATSDVPILMLTARVEEARGGGEVRLTVANTGEGIAAQDLPFIFERFYRGEKSRSREWGGAGIGLAIVKEVAGAHGGRVGASSEDGLTRVWLALSGSP